MNNTNELKNKIRVSNRFAPPSPLFKAHPLGFRLVMEIDKK